MLHFLWLRFTLHKEITSSRILYLLNNKSLLQSPSVVCFWHTFPERCPCPQLCSPVQCSCPSARDLLPGERPCLLRSPQSPAACLEWAAPCWSHTCRWTRNRKLCAKRYGGTNEPGDRRMADKRWKKQWKRKEEEEKKWQEKSLFCECIQLVQKLVIYSLCWRITRVGLR